LAAAAVPAIIPAAASGRNGSVAPSNRIVMGCIGVGGMGTNDLRGFMGKPEVRIVAVCDVDKGHREDAKRIVDKGYSNSDCAAYNDFREITRRDDIDAVCIATPDHWHAISAVDAVKHGKDAYVEKPLTLTIREGRILSDAVRRYCRVVQTGSQQRSDQRFRQACELVRNGRLGKIHTINVQIPANNKTCDPTWSPQPIPDGFDYDFWLGQAPWEPYHPQRCHYEFRFLLDYSGGQVTNWGAHYLDIAQWALGMDNSGPVEVSGKGEFPTSGLFTTATNVHFECVYAGGVRLICTTRHDGVGDGTIKFEGTGGRLEVNRNGITSDPPSILRDPIGPQEIHLYESRDHQQNFLDCIRTRTRPIADVEIGHRSATVCHLGNIAMLLGRNLHWDPRSERFINDEEADRMTTRAMRGPWYL
jgi:predicted dehydrogenase